MTTATLEAPRAAAVQTRAQPPCEQIACACGPATPYLQIVGLTAGPETGQPVVVAAQNKASARGSWMPAGTPLTGAPGDKYLTDITICPSPTATLALGLGSDGAVYQCGAARGDANWQPGPGLISQTPTFRPGTLSSALLSTPTCFALTSAGAPWVAAYRLQSAHHPWSGGYALPLPVPAPRSFTTLVVRPDVGPTRTTHAIGLGADGRAYAIARTRVGESGIGPASWTPGQGALGDGTVPFRQLLVISGDAAGILHVVGLGTDGSVWDIDQFHPTGATASWSGKSFNLLPAGCLPHGKIECHLTGSGPTLTLNLIALRSSRLTIVAQFTAQWTATNKPIPTSATPTDWYVVPNHAYATTHGYQPAAFLLGVSDSGFVHELAYYAAGTWSFGSALPLGPERT